MVSMKKQSKGTKRLITKKKKKGKRSDGGRGVVPWWGRTHVMNAKDGDTCLDQTESE